MDTHPESPSEKEERVAATSAKDRKYWTEAEARRGGATWWREESWPECLYKKLTVGRYFYRARTGTSRPFLQLEADDLKVAKRRLRDKMSEVADLRASGQNVKSAEFRTLGACAEEMLRIVKRSDRDERTRQAYENHVDRLRTHWQRGNFESYPAARVDLDAIMDLRDHLKNRAVFVAGRVGPNTKRLKMRTGFSNNIVNQTMWALRVCLDIAVDKRVRVENPFLTKSTLEKKINLPKVRRRPDLPPTDVMQKLFAEMRSVPDAARISTQRGGAFLSFRQQFANQNADLAEFLAYTGCRHEEALDVRVGNINKNAQGFLFVDGTKSQQSKRDVPIMVPELRPLLARLAFGKQPNDTLFPPTADCLAALARACRRLGIPKLVQHELRHLFATVALEEGVSFPLLAEWLGHSDGGMLAAKTYGHIRKVHALAEADRIMASLAKKFGATDINAPTPANPVGPKGVKTESDAVPLNFESSVPATVASPQSTCA